MPIYEYTCSACGHAFEHLARTLSDKPEKCPSCGAQTLRKGFSTFAPASAAGKACRGCAGEPACSAAGLSGCGCAGACGHHH